MSGMMLRWTDIFPGQGKSKTGVRRCLGESQDLNANLRGIPTTTEGGAYVEREQTEIVEADARQAHG